MIASWVWIGLAWAASGETWLTKVDAAMTAAADAHLFLDVREEGDAKGAKTLEVWQRGEARKIKVLAPEKIAGLTLWVAETGAMSLLLPAYNRVMRVEGKGRAAGLAGMNLPIEDLGRTSFSKDYTARVIEEGAAVVRLALDPKGDASPARLTVESATGRWTLLEHLDPEGAPTQEIRLSPRARVDGYDFALVTTVTDLHKGTTVTLTAREVDFDSGLPEALFTPTRQD